MNKGKIIYSINIEDIQTVALQEIERELSEEELKIIELRIGDFVKWYDIISDIFTLEGIR